MTKQLKQALFMSVFLFSVTVSLLLLPPVAFGLLIAAIIFRRAPAHRRISVMALFAGVVFLVAGTMDPLDPDEAALVEGGNNGFNTFQTAKCPKSIPCSTSTCLYNNKGYYGVFGYWIPGAWYCNIKNPPSANNGSARTRYKDTYPQTPNIILNGNYVVTGKASYYCGYLKGCQKYPCSSTNVGGKNIWFCTGNLQYGIGPVTKKYYGNSFSSAPNKNKNEAKGD